MQLSNPIIFFDGVCNLCNHFIDFLVRNDQKKKFRYAPLQGQTAKDLLDKKAQQIDTVVLYQDGKMFFKAKAVAIILQQLNQPYIFLGKILNFLPSFLSDLCYDIVARSRYFIFGKRSSCRLPTQEEIDLFLE